VTRRCALVTGSSGGIGLAIAKGLLADGFTVIGIDIRRRDSDEFVTLSADLGLADECRRVAGAVERVDVLVNNAAVLHEVPLADLTADDVEQVMAVNFVAPLMLSKSFGERMAARGWGRIINVASVGARTGGNPMSAPYAASKAALVSLTKNLARNYGRFGVTVNAVAPGAIDTPMARGQFGNSFANLDDFLKDVPVGRLGRPDEVADLVRFLASQRSSFVTGATIDINGGWHMA
jgi:3-oxoacyl-[acyl-carrier protein] reductase